MSQQTSRVREMLQRAQITRGLVAHDVFSAQILEQAGIELLFVGGFGVAASRLGVPDIGLLSLDEMVDTVRAITRRVSIPVIADADTGHGDLQNVQWTIQRFEEAGAAGVLLEDQQDPKRCGHFEGQRVIDCDAMVEKLQAAVAAKEDSEFTIIARTDSRSTHGLDEAIRRIRAYMDAGADAGFIEAPREPEELRRIAAELPFPLLANMLTDGKTPLIKAETLEEWGYRLVVCPVAGLAATGFALKLVAENWLNQGELSSMRDSMLGFEELKKTVGLDRIEAHMHRMRNQSR